MDRFTEEIAKAAARETKIETLVKVVRNFMLSNNFSAEKAMAGLCLDPEDRDLIRDFV